MSEKWIPPSLAFGASEEVRRCREETPRSRVWGEAARVGEGAGVSGTGEKALRLAFGAKEGVDNKDYPSVSCANKCRRGCAQMGANKRRQDEVQQRPSEGSTLS